MHAANYTRIYNSEVLRAVGERPIRFEPPPKGSRPPTANHPRFPEFAAALPRYE